MFDRSSILDSSLGIDSNGVLKEGNVSKSVYRRGLCEIGIRILLFGCMYFLLFYSFITLNKLFKMSMNRICDKKIKLADLNPYKL